MANTNLKPEAHRRLRAFFLTAKLTKEHLTPADVVYHGTSRIFKEFKKSNRNPSTPVDEVNAFFFTPDYTKAVFHARRSAKVFGGTPRVIAVKLKFKKLCDVTNKVKKLQKELGLFGQAKRQVYSEVDASKWDGIEFRGDNVNQPEYVVFNPEVIDIINVKELGDIKKRVEYVKKIEANEKLVFTKEGREKGKDFNGKWVLDIYDVKFGNEKVRLSVKVYSDGGTAKVNIFGNSTNKFGTVNARGIINFIKNKYKNITHVYGDRISGARKQSGKKLNTAYIKIRNIEANDDRKLGKSLYEQGQSVVVIYRACAVGVNSFKDRDYVTLFSKFAKEHAEHNAIVNREQQHVIKTVVTGRDVFDAYNPGEYFYSGPEKRGRVVYVTENEIEASKTTVLKNPTTKALIRLLNNAEYKEVKGLIVKDDVYWWNNVEDWHHGNQAHKLGLVPEDVDPYTNIKNFSWQRLNLMYEGDNNGVERLYLENYGKEATIGQSLDLIFKNAYLRKFIKEADVYVDDIKSEDHDIISGVDYMKEHHLTASIKPTVLKNPPYKKVMILLKNAQYNELKGLIVGTDVYWWNQVEDLQHGDMAKRLGLVKENSHAYIGKDFDENCLVLMYVEHPKGINNLSLVNTDHSVDSIVKNDYLKKFIIQENLYLDDNSKKDSFFNGREYLEASEFSYNGFWINPEGKLIKVTVEHKITLKKIGYNKSIIDALEEGWLRLGLGSTGFYLQLVYGKTTQAGLKTLLKWIKENTWEKCEIEIVKDFSDPNYMNYTIFKHFNISDEKKLVNFLRSIIHKEIRADDQYGYWFCNDGKRLDVEEMRHNDVASKVIARDHYKEYMDWVIAHDAADYKEFALQELGWIRVTVTDYSLNIEIKPNKVSNEAQRTLSQYLRSENTTDECWLDAGSRHMHFELPKKQSALIAEIRRNIKHHNLEASVTSDEYFSVDAIKLVKDETKPPKSRSTLIYMKPSDFLKMADVGHSDIKSNLIKTLTDNRIQFNQVPHLLFKNNGNGTATVIGHEGRHRAKYLVSIGDKEMPVVFKSVEGGKGPAIRWGSQDNEFDRVDVWPKILVGEGKNKNNKMSFPNSIVYPRETELTALNEKEIIVIDEENNVVSNIKEKLVEHWITETDNGSILIVQIEDNYFVRVYDQENNLISTEEFAFEETAKDFVHDLVFNAKQLGVTFQLQESKKYPLEAAIPTKVKPNTLYNRFSKQPDIPGINLVFTKASSYIYYKINHNATGKPIVVGTNKPLNISLSKLVEYINISPLKTIDWTIKTGEELAKNYGLEYIRSMLQGFKLAIEQGTEGAFRTYLNNFDSNSQIQTKEDEDSKYLSYAKEVARAMASGSKLHEAMRSVPDEYKNIVGKIIAKALPKVVKQLYKSGDKDQQARALQLTLNNVPLKQRISKLPSKDACTLYSLAHVTGKSLEELWPILKPYFGRKNLFGGRGMNLQVLAVLIRQLGYTITVNNKYTSIPDKPQPWGRVKKQVLDQSLPYLVAVKGHLIGIANGTVKDTGNTSDNEPVLIAFSLSPTEAKKPVVDKKMSMQETLLEKERELAEIKGNTPETRLEFKNKQREVLELHNKLRGNKDQGVHAYRFRIGAYVSGQVKGYKDQISEVRGLLVRENSFKNNGIASGGILIMDKEGNLSSIEATHLKRLFVKPPKELKARFDKMVEKGVIKV